MKTKNCVMMSRPNHSSSTVRDSPAFFLASSSLPAGPLNILANAASLSRQMLMFANVLISSTGVAGDAPTALATCAHADVAG